MVKICAVVVTYYPDIEILKKNIYSFITYVDKVLIWENTPSIDRDKYRIEQDDKIEYCHGNINSISFGLNYAWNYSVSNKYTHLLTMDQDSEWENFSSFLDKTVFNPQAPVGIMGPSVNDENHNTDFFCKVLITSGMLVPIWVLNSLKGYNENFEIDGIDSWLCCLARERGIGTYCVRGCKLVQKFGNLHQIEVGGAKFSTLDYSSKRLYEIYKSYIVLWRRFELPEELKTQLYHYLFGKWLIKILFGERDRKNKFIQIIKGIRDGFKYKLEQ